MAREDVRTVIGGCCAVDILQVLCVAETEFIVPSMKGIVVPHLGFKVEVEIEWLSCQGSIQS